MFIRHDKTFLKQIEKYFNDIHTVMLSFRRRHMLMPSPHAIITTPSDESDKSSIPTRIRSATNTIPPANCALSLGRNKVSMWTHL